MITLGFGSADAQENLTQQVSAIFQQNCSNCHGPSGSFKEALLLDRTALIDMQVVIIGNPENSEFYKRLLGPTENGPQMPLNLPPLSPEAVETIARWITAGAPDWDVQGDSHSNYWYSFWDADLAQPMGEKGQRYENTDGIFIREFTNGWAVYNRSGKIGSIQLPKPATGIHSSVRSTTHSLHDLDGEIYLK